MAKAPESLEKGRTLLCFPGSGGSLESLEDGLFWKDTNISCDFWEGGETCYRVRPPKPVVEGSESGSGLVRARSLKKKTEHEQGGGDLCHRWGCPKQFLGRGFMVCFPLSWDFHPLCFSLKRLLPSGRTWLQMKIRCLLFEWKDI